MALSDLQVFQEQTYLAVTELQDQYIKLFNEATQGGITLTAAARQGDFSETAFWGKIPGLVRRRDAYGGDPVTPVNLEHLLAVSVKVAGGTPPVRIDPGMLLWIQQNPNVAAAQVGKQLAEDMLADQLNTALAAYVAAIGAQTTNVHDGTAGVASLASLVQAAGKLGDRAQSIECWVLHSKAATDIYGAAVTNSNNLFSIATVKVVQDGFGRPLVVTDSPALVSGAVYNTVGLVSGAIAVETNNDWIDNIETSNGNENIIRTYQAEWSYNLGIKGFAWDTAVGGPSPTDAAIGTAANWKKTATSHKDLAGVLLTSD